MLALFLVANVTFAGSESNHTRTLASAIGVGATRAGGDVRIKSVTEADYEKDVLEWVGICSR